MKRYAFTLMELIIGIMILTITSMVIIVNVNAVRGQSAKREAEKLAHWLTVKMSIADSQKKTFSLMLNSGKIFVWWGESRLYEADKEFFEASKGCSFELTAPNDKLDYSVVNNNFSQGGHIKVIGKEGPTAPYYVIIATIGGRIRVDDEAP